MASATDRRNDAVAAEVKALCPQVEFGEVPPANDHVTLDNRTGFNVVLRRFLER